MTSWRLVSERLVVLQMQHKHSKKATIIVAYGPNESDEKETKEDFRADLQQCDETENLNLNGREKLKGWWNDDIKATKKQKKASWKKCLYTKSRSDYEQYKANRIKVKNKVKEAKQKSWEDFGNKMEMDGQGSKNNKNVPEDSRLANLRSGATNGDKKNKSAGKDLAQEMLNGNQNGIQECLLQQCDRAKRSNSCGKGRNDRANCWSSPSSANTVVQNLEVATLNCVFAWPATIDELVARALEIDSRIVKLAQSEPQMKELP
ncbi:hypothetical protein ILUMI_26431 [Ignelater luminosus]|uniref:Uncharacterized protein n=1 Tax=Ignelater luminosus TaxID=2038154 RepID=A0A8K0C3T1_IGNLU|nr:hypothetical protein ILUMI_26431 [Ignelater luminosus]